MAKIYVSWEEREIMTEEEYKNHLNKYLEEQLSDKYNMDEFLCENYTIGEVWLMTPKEREKVLADAREAFSEQFDEEMDIEDREISITM